LPVDESSRPASPELTWSSVPPPHPIAAAITVPTEIPIRTRKDDMAKKPSRGSPSKGTPHQSKIRPNAPPQPVEADQGSRGCGRGVSRKPSWHHASSLAS
jgi:hypothetical protein